VTKVVILGSGTPIADPERFGSAVAIVVDDVPYLVDCGAGVVRRAAAVEKSGISALNVKNLIRLFVTHLHSDHTVGYADLILTPWVIGRDEPLEVYGPKGISDMTEHILAAYEQDIEIRLHGLEPSNDQGYRVKATEIKPGPIYQDANVSVEAIGVKHGSWSQAFGFVFQTPDKRVVISGDTIPHDSIVEASRDCDILIHEVYSADRFQQRSEEWQKYHASFHTSTRELAEIASRARPKLLVLYHQLFWGCSEEELLSEIRATYDGPVVSGKDLDIF